VRTKIVLALLLAATIVFGAYEYMRPLTSEEVERNKKSAWLRRQTINCDQLKGKLTVPNNNTVECYRTPFMRMPALQFTSTYGEKPVTQERGLVNRIKKMF